MIHATTMHPRNRRRGGILGWLLMSFVLLIFLAAAAGFYTLRNVRVHQSVGGRDVQVDTPFGSVHVQHDEKGVRQPAGIPLYPGAKPLNRGESASVDLSGLFGGEDGLHIVAGKWETPDSISKVQKFYENRFPEMNVIHHTGKVEMHSIDGYGKRVIVLRDRGGSTEIALASVGEPKAN